MLHSVKNPTQCPYILVHIANPSPLLPLYYIPTKSPYVPPPRSTTRKSLVFKNEKWHMYTLEKNEFCKIHLDSLTTTTHIIIRRCVVRLAWMLRKIWRRYENLPLDIMPSMALLLSLQSLNPERYKALPWSYSVTTKKQLNPILATVIMWRVD